MTNVSIDSKIHKTQKLMIIKSHFVKALVEYHVRFFNRPKPRSSIALLMSSILSRLVKTSGNSIVRMPESRALSDAFFEISTPRAC